MGRREAWAVLFLAPLVSFRSNWSACMVRPARPAGLGTGATGISARNGKPGLMGSMQMVMAVSSGHGHA